MKPIISMKPIIRVGLVALVMASAVWSKSQAAEPVVGSWRLVSWIEVETESKAAHATHGPKALQRPRSTTLAR